MSVDKKQVKKNTIARTAPKTFETCQIELKVRSGHLFTVYLSKITPPEFLVLQQVHGAEGVKFITRQGPSYQVRMDENGKWQKRPTTAKELLEKLGDKYKPSVVAKVFPGANPILPFTFDAISANLSQVEETPDDEENWTPMGEDELSEDELEKLTAPKAEPLDFVGNKTK